MIKKYRVLEGYLLADNFEDLKFIIDGTVLEGSDFNISNCRTCHINLSNKFVDQKLINNVHKTSMSRLQMILKGNGKYYDINNRYKKERCMSVPFP